jgi:hypothetical protein
VTALDVSTLVASACERAGHDDFGEDTWQEGLDVLVWALEHEASLNELGEAVFADQIGGYLVNRLEVESWYARHPEIAEQEIVAPLFGVGMPRTGSTAVSFLLACDRSKRYLRTWEASTPCPPPESATEDSDPRIAVAAAGIEMTHEMFPDFAGMLPSSATGPQECILLTALDFRSQVFEGMALLPSFTKWFLSSDATPGYRYHERVLKLLQWRCPPTHWWLKSPAHLTTIDALAAVYPDARFVMTHRDLGHVLPSVCALKHALGSPLADGLDLHALGRHETELWSRSLRTTIEFRDNGNEHRFFDVDFADVQHDPIGAMARLYDAMGDEFTADTRAAMETWWQESADERRRGPRPDPATYGLDLDALRSEFAFYHERFSVPSG